MGFGDFLNAVIEKTSEVIGTANDVIQTANDKAIEFLDKKELERQDKKILKENRSIGIDGFISNAIFPINGQARLEEACFEIKNEFSEDEIQIKIGLQEFKSLLNKNNLAHNWEQKISYFPFDDDLVNILSKFFNFHDNDNNGYAFLDMTSNQCKLNGVLFTEEGIIGRIGTEKPFLLTWNEWTNSIYTEKTIEENDQNKNLKISKFTLFNGKQFSCISDSGLSVFRENILDTIDSSKLSRERNMVKFFLYLEKCLMEETKVNNLSLEEVNQMCCQLSLMESAAESVEQICRAFALKAIAFRNYLKSIESVKLLRNFQEKVDLLKKRTEEYRINEVDELVEEYEEKLKCLGPMLQKELQQIAIEDNVEEAKRMEKEIDYLGMNVFLYSVIYDTTKILDELKFSDQKNDFGFDAYSFMPINRDRGELVSLIKKKDPDTARSIKAAESSAGWAEIKGELGSYDSSTKSYINSMRHELEGKKCLENAKKRCYDSALKLIDFLSNFNQEDDVDNKLKEVESKISEIKECIPKVSFNSDDEGQEKRRLWLENTRERLVNEFKKSYEEKFYMQKDEFETTDEYEMRRINAIDSKMSEVVEEFKKNQLENLVKDEEEKLLRNRTANERKKLNELELQKNEFEVLKLNNTMKAIVAPRAVLDTVNLINYNADNEAFESQVVFCFKSRKIKIEDQIRLKVPRSIAREFKAEFDTIIFKLDSIPKFKKVYSEKETKLIIEWDLFLKCTFMEHDFKEKLNYEEIIIDIPNDYEPYNYEYEIRRLYQ